MSTLDKQPRVLVEMDYDCFGVKVVSAIHTDLAHEDVVVVDYTDETDNELTATLDSIAMKCIPNLQCIYSNPDVACTYAYSE